MRPRRRMAISQESAQQAQTLQTCAGIFVAEGASSGMHAASASAVLCYNKRAFVTIAHCLA